MDITVIGCGRWGSLITWYLDHIGHRVTLYGRAASPRMQSFLATRQNDLLTLPASVALSTDLTAALNGAETVIISIGSQSLAQPDRGRVPASVQRRGRVARPRPCAGVLPRHPQLYGHRQ